MERPSCSPVTQHSGEQPEGLEEQRRGTILSQLALSAGLILGRSHDHDG